MKTLLGTSSLALLAVVTLNQQHAFAADATDNVAVTAEVLASCNITGGTMAFGTYDTITAIDVDQTLDLTVACTKGTNATIFLGEGVAPNAGSTAAAPLRELTAGGAVLTYNLYSDSGRTSVWEAVTATGETYVAADSTDSLITIYGRVDASQDVAVGSYTDTIVATISF